MKKLFVLAMMATLLVAGSAFAVLLTPTQNATFSFGAPGIGFGPTTTNNDDSCDISVAPAATLLLPYFEVDFNSPQATARTTLFTITNVSRLPQIAHVTIWTDLSQPILDFNIFLTGYDVQGINLYDIIGRGIIAPGSGVAGANGTSSNITVPTNPTNGSQPALNLAGPTGNQNITTLANCTNLPGQIPPSLLSDLRAVLTTGLSVNGAVGCASNQRIGTVHANAIGYVTIDVASNCSTSLPNALSYFQADILFDNVLIGDFEDLNATALKNDAGGSPLVHIRAIPEGGPSGAAAVTTNLPFTFYNRYSIGGSAQNSPLRYFDRRQPLPVAFAARYIQGGTQNFNTNLKIWREGLSGEGTGCGSINGLNGSIAFTEIVRFDEHENATVAGGGVIISPAPTGSGTIETQSLSTTNGLFPPMSTSGDVAGWLYLNLSNNANTTLYSSQRAGFLGAAPTRTQSQNWVIISMSANTGGQGLFSVDFDAAWLGNGCSPAPAATAGALPGSAIGPAGGVLVCPVPTTCTPATSYTGTNVTP